MIVFSSVIRSIGEKVQKRKWRKRNSDNLTSMGNTFNPELVTVGKKTYGELNIINHSDSYRLFLGNYVSIAPEVLFIVCGDHSIHHISTYPFKVRYRFQKQEALSKGDIVVGDDVWIGARATILSGVRIGQGAIIGAGSLVTRDVPPYAIVGGVPARIIRYRFSKELVQKLEKIDFSAFNDKIVLDNIELLYSDVIDTDDLLRFPQKDSSYEKDGDYD